MSQTANTQKPKPISLCQVLGKGKPLMWRGKTIQVVPFDLNDIADLEDNIGGDVANFNMARIRHQMVILWIALRRNDETLTADDRAHCRYKMSLQDLGRSVKAYEMNDPQVFQFIVECVRLSEIYGPAEIHEGDAEESGSASKNAEATSDSTGANSSPS